MRHRRAAALLVAHSLGEDRPLAEAIGRIGGPAAPRAAAFARAGDLSAALGALGVDPLLQRAAELWPAAAPGVLRRLDSLPSPRGVQVRLVETLAYLLVVTLLQLGVLAVLGSKMRLHMQVFAEITGVWKLGWLVPATLVLGALFSLGCLLLTLVLLKPDRLPVWSRWHRVARRAAFVGGMLDAEPPPEVRAQLLEGEGGGVHDHDALLSLACARMEVSGDRLISGLRFGGLTVLVGLALALTWSIYSSVTWMPL